MAYLLAIGSAVLYGAADFTGGLTTRRASPIPVVLLSQAAGLIMLALIMPLLPQASPARADVLWGAAAGLSGGIGVALLYHALATGTMAVVAPTTAVCAVAIPVVVSGLLGERPMPLAAAGIALGMVSIVLVIFAGVMDMLANALYLLATRQGPLSIVVTLSSLYPASTVLLARIVLGERLRPWQVTGIGCALAAVVLIVSAGR